MRRVLLDASLVVLLVVGNVGRERVTEHKRLSSYAPEDWDRLIAELSRYDQIVVTPNILTEASNHIRTGDKANQAQYAAVFGQLAFEVIEHYLPSDQAVLHPDFSRLGLADVASLLVNQNELTLLTVDAGLYVAALTHGLEAQNFNHIRDPR